MLWHCSSSGFSSINQVVQVLIGPDERLSGQDALGLQFGDGLMGRLTKTAFEERGHLTRELDHADDYPFQDPRAQHSCLNAIVIPNYHDRVISRWPIVVTEKRSIW